MSASVAPQMTEHDIPPVGAPVSPSASARSPSPPGGRRPGGSPARRSLFTLVRAAVTLALLALSLRGVEWGRLRSVFVAIDWRWWLVGLALLVSVQVVAAVRWAVLARPVGFQLPLASFIRRFFEGLFFNLVLPTSIGGDVVKAYRLADTPGGRVLAGCTVLADRLAGLTALSVIAVTALAVHRFALGPSAAVAIAAALTLAIVAVARAIVGNLDRILGAIPVRGRLESLAARLLPYQKRPGLVASAIGWGMLVQIGGVLGVACIGRSLGLDVALPTWFMAVPLVNLATVLPISIGGVGVREGMLSALLAPAGVPTEKAVAIGMLTLLTMIVCGVAGGIAFLAAGRTPPAADPPR